MDEGTIQKVIANLRNPVNAKVKEGGKVYFTSRSIRFLTILFNRKRIDAIDLHYILLKIACITGCFHINGNNIKKYINLKDLVVYLYSQTPPCISYTDIRDVAGTFNIDNDSDYKEVEDMKIIVDNITSEN